MLVSPILTTEEARKSSMKMENSNKLKFDQDEYSKLIEQIRRLTLQNDLNMSQCRPESLPAFLQEADKKQNIENIYVLTNKDGSKTYCTPAAGGGRDIQFLSDHWTESSIDELAQLASRMPGSRWSILPPGTPGEFPPHLRAYAVMAFAKHGVVLHDSYSVTPEMIEASQKKYGRPEVIAPIIEHQNQYKEALGKIKSKNPLNPTIESEEVVGNNLITPLRITPKPDKD